MLRLLLMACLVVLHSQAASSRVAYSWEQEMLSGGFDKIHNAGCADPDQGDARKVAKRCTTIIDGSQWTDNEKLRARFYRGLANAVIGKFDQVVEDLNLYIAGFSDDSLARKARGLAFEALGNRPKAIDDYSEIVRRSFYDDMPWARAALRRLGAPNPAAPTLPPPAAYPLPQAAARRPLRSVPTSSSPYPTWRSRRHRAQPRRRKYLSSLGPAMLRPRLADRSTPSK